MHKKSSIAVAFCVAALTGLSAAPAFAGEVTGPPGAGGGTPTPIKSGVASSICAFSGLNDFTEGRTSFHVQSYGIDVSGKGEEPFGQPGLGEVNCRGNN